MVAVSKVQRTRDVAAAAIYVVYETRKNKRKGLVRADAVSYNARGVGDVDAFVAQVRGDVGRFSRRQNEALVVTQAFEPGTLDRNNELHVQWAHSMGVELAEKLAPGSDVLVATHTDGKNGNCHNHIVIANHDYVTGRTPKTVKNAWRLKAVNDEVLTSNGFTPLGQDEITRSQAERLAEAEGRSVDAGGLELHELDGDTWRSGLRLRIDKLVEDKAVVAASPDQRLKVMKKRAKKHDLDMRVRTIRKGPDAGKPAATFALIDGGGERLKIKTAKSTCKASAAGSDLGADYKLDRLIERIELARQIQLQKQQHQVRIKQLGLFEDGEEENNGKTHTEWLGDRREDRGADESDLGNHRAVEESHSEPPEAAGLTATRAAVGGTVSREEFHGAQGGAEGVRAAAALRQEAEEASRNLGWGHGVQTSDEGLAYGDRPDDAAACEATRKPETDGHSADGDGGTAKSRPGGKPRADTAERACQHAIVQQHQEATSGVDNEGDKQPGD